MREKKVLQSANKITLDPWMNFRVLSVHIDQSRVAHQHCHQPISVAQIVEALLTAQKGFTIHYRFVLTAIFFLIC